MVIDWQNYKPETIRMFFKKVKYSEFCTREDEIAKAMVLLPSKSPRRACGYLFPSILVSDRQQKILELEER